MPYYSFEIRVPEKKTLVLSDIHIGRKGANWKRALDLMNKYNWKRIIICGDFFDLWYKPTAIFALLLITLFKKIGNKIIYVTGNHDREIFELLYSKDPFAAVVRRYEETIGDKKFTFIHGHEADRFNNEKSWIGEFLTKIQAIVHKLIRVDTHRLTSGLLFRIMERKQRKILTEKYCKEENSVLVFGHTHKPIATKTKKYECYNAGDWVRNNTFLIIDENGKVFRYKDMLNKSVTVYEVIK